jgi:hypothetical protein
MRENISFSYLRLYIAVTALSNCDHGGFPLPISMTVQAKDQMSAFVKPSLVAVSAITSGAIHKGVP